MGNFRAPQKKNVLCIFHDLRVMGTQKNSAGVGKTRRKPENKRLFPPLPQMYAPHAFGAGGGFFFLGEKTKKSKKKAKKRKSKKKAPKKQMPSRERADELLRRADAHMRRGDAHMRMHYGMGLVLSPALSPVLSSVAAAGLAGLAAVVPLVPFGDVSRVVTKAWTDYAKPAIGAHRSGSHRTTAQKLRRMDDAF